MNHLTPESGGTKGNKLENNLADAQLISQTRKDMPKGPVEAQAFQSALNRQAKLDHLTSKASIEPEGPLEAQAFQASLSQNSTDSPKTSYEPYQAPPSPHTLTALASQAPLQTKEPRAPQAPLTSQGFQIPQEPQGSLTSQAPQQTKEPRAPQAPLTSRGFQIPQEPQGSLTSQVSQTELTEEDLLERQLAENKMMANRKDLF